MLAQPAVARLHLVRHEETAGLVRSLHDRGDLAGGRRPNAVARQTAVKKGRRETVELRSETEGRVAGIKCRAVGQAAMLLGAGRETVDSRIDPAVGIVLHKKVGDPVREGESLMTLHVNERGRLDEATRLLRQAVRVAREAPPPAPLVRLVLDA